jgi:arginine metabolism regulation protein II
MRPATAATPQLGLRGPQVLRNTNDRNAQRLSIYECCTERPKKVSKGRISRIKRTKTFSGCWTCRSRGVKCGEERPTCQRCRHSKLACGGYEVGLVWPDQRSTQRRILLDQAQSYIPVLSNQQIHSALESIDATQRRDGLTIGLFSVFLAASDNNKSPSDSDRAENYLTDTPLLPIESLEVWKIDENSDHRSFQHFLLLQNIEKLYLEDARSNRMGDAETGFVPYITPQLDIFSSDYSFLSLGSKHDRQLMYYWVTSLSGLMTSTQRWDNFFQDIITPLALAATNVHHDSFGHRALLHSLYALAAFNRAKLCAFSQTEQEAGAKHVKESLQYLSRSLKSSGFEQQLATLAVILMLAVIPSFTGETSDWRVHFRGGRTWLRSIDQSAWRRSRSAVTLYQIFLCMNVLRPTHHIIAKDLEPQIYSLEYLGLEEQISIQAAEQLDGDSMRWHLDTLWGLTQPIMSAIHQINQWIFQEYTPSAEEMESLRLKIIRSEPSNERFSSPTNACEELTRRHACTFYYACQVYFYCSLQKLPPHYIQHIVRQSIEHIETIEILETDLNVSGLLWPAFIIACETDDIDLRPRIMRYFNKRETLGIGNVSAAKKVVLTVWSRRDKAQVDENTLWYYVMAEMGIDMLLL